MLAMKNGNWGRGKRRKSTKFQPPSNKEIPSFKHLRFITHRAGPVDEIILFAYRAHWLMSAQNEAAFSSTTAPSSWPSPPGGEGIRVWAKSSLLLPAGT